MLPTGWSGLTFFAVGSIYQEAGIMDATHLRWFTEKTLRLLLENAGYRVDEWRVTCGNWMPEYAWKRPFRWMRESHRTG